MKIGKLASVNSKGQFVIPQEYRKMFNITEGVVLNITTKYTGIFLEPIEEVLPKISENSTYLDVLDSTKGSWKQAKVKDDNKRDLEIEASKRRKKEW